MRALKYYLAVSLLLLPMTARAADIEVYKSPTCGCCKKWIDHLEQSGFRVKAHDVSDVVQYKIKYGLSPDLGSCHTALVEGYVIEGHVPADDIKKLLMQKPKAAGLAVPGMPVGSPGMEVGNRRDSYDVLLFSKDGSRKVFSSYR